MAADPETGERGPREVTHVWVHDDELVDLDLGNGETVTTTEDHPFWNDSDQQWQQAQHLTPGDNLLTPSGRIAVAGLDWDTIQRGPAYNLTVTDIHTYYVLAGNTPVLVHNSGPYCGIPIGNKKSGNAAFHGTNYSLDEMVQFAHGHTGAGNPAMGRPGLAEIEATLRNAGPVRLKNSDGSWQNSAKFDHNGVRVIINYDQPWKSTTYYRGN